MIKQTIPFTYSIYHKKSDRWYYGVKYADGCKPSDLGITYFSSSPIIKNLIKEFGISDFEFKIRKIFNDKKKAIDWETRFLSKIKSSKIRHKFINKCFGPAFWPIMYGESNPAKTDVVRKKLSDLSKNRSKETLRKISVNGSKTKIKKNIGIKIKKIRLFRNNLNFEIIRHNNLHHGDSIRKYLDYLENIQKPFTNVKCILNKILIILEEPRVKIYPKKRRKPRFTIESSNLRAAKIKESKLGKVFAENVFTNERKYVKMNEIGDIWVKTKMHDEASLKKISNASLNSSAETKRKQSEGMRKSRANSKYYTSPDLLMYKSYKNWEDIPDGWIPGIKVESRNKKVGENNRWSKKEFNEENC